MTRKTGFRSSIIPIDIKFIKYNTYIVYTYIMKLCTRYKHIIIFCVHTRLQIHRLAVRVSWSKIQFYAFLVCLFHLFSHLLTLSLSPKCHRMVLCICMTCIMCTRLSRVFYSTQHRVIPVKTAVYTFVFITWRPKQIFPLHVVTSLLYCFSSQYKYTVIQMSYYTCYMLYTALTYHIM